VVTVKVYAPAESPEKVVVEPLPEAIVPIGLEVIIQLSVVGNPLRATLPELEVHVGCVINPITGAVGTAVITTLVVADTTPHPPAAAIVYVTVYVPAVLVPGVIAPDVALIVNPVVEEYLPPEVPVLVTAWAVVRLLQKGVPEYDIVAAGKGVTFTVKDAVFVLEVHPAVEISVSVAVPVYAGAGVQVAFNVLRSGEKEPPAPLSDQTTDVVPRSIWPPRFVSVLP
jgi:hypothetical protein